MRFASSCAKGGGQGVLCRVKWLVFMIGEKKYNINLDFTLIVFSFRFHGRWFEVDVIALAISIKCWFFWILFSLFIIKGVHCSLVNGKYDGFRLGKAWTSDSTQNVRAGVRVDVGFHSKSSCRSSRNPNSCGTNGIRSRIQALYYKAKSFAMRSINIEKQYIGK